MILGRPTGQPHPAAAPHCARDGHVAALGRPGGRPLAERRAGSRWVMSWLLLPGSRVGQGDVRPVPAGTSGRPPKRRCHRRPRSRPNRPRAWARLRGSAAARRADPIVRRPWGLRVNRVRRAISPDMVPPCGVCLSPTPQIRDRTRMATACSRRQAGMASTKPSGKYSPVGDGWGRPAGPRSSGLVRNPRSGRLRVRPGKRTGGDEAPWSCCRATHLCGPC